eukprot:4519412-Alexandrium_andersonii.AAC.1
MAGRLRVEPCGPPQLARALDGRARRRDRWDRLRAARGLPPASAWSGRRTRARGDWPQSWTP